MLALGMVSIKKGTSKLVIKWTVKKKMIYLVLLESSPFMKQRHHSGHKTLGKQENRQKENTANATR